MCRSSRRVKKLMITRHILRPSVRDTKYFLERGFAVEAMDGSAELCKLASAYTGIKVKQMLFSELDAVEKYDGIWACASILHLAWDELVAVLQKMVRAVKAGGVIYTSFKYGQFTGERNGRFFTDLDEEGLARLLKAVGGLEVKELWITGDVRPGRGEEKWLNVLLTGNGAGAVCRCGQGVCASFGDHGYDEGVQDACAAVLL